MDAPTSGASLNSWRTLDLEALGPNRLRGRKKKKLDPSDFVQLEGVGEGTKICHQKCSGRLIGLMALVWDIAPETWTVRSLKLQSGGVPIKHALECDICTSEDKDWIYEPKKSVI